MRRAMLIAAMLVILAAAGADAGTIVRFDTILGDIGVNLRDALAPVTVANFLNYVDDGDYTDSFFHRSVWGFVIQGGGCMIRDNTFYYIPTDDPIVNEFDPDTMSNTRGTIAMARGVDLNSATSQWFFNLNDNTGLDDPLSPYCVFGDVIAGMNVVDLIATVPVWDLTGDGWPFDEWPLMNYDPQAGLYLTNLVMVFSVSVAGDANANGVVDYFDLGILATNYDHTPAGWTDGDFNFDGVVNYFDLGMLATEYDRNVGGSPVPEPAALSLLALGASLVLARRSRIRPGGRRP